MYKKILCNQKCGQKSVLRKICVPPYINHRSKLYFWNFPLFYKTGICILGILYHFLVLFPQAQDVIDDALVREENHTKISFFSYSKNCSALICVLLTLLRDCFNYVTVKYPALNCQLRSKPYPVTWIETIMCLLHFMVLVF